MTNFSMYIDRAYKDKDKDAGKHCEEIKAVWP